MADKKKSKSKKPNPFAKKDTGPDDAGGNKAPPFFAKKKAKK